ncbi:MAG: SPFH domain-containing protein [Ruminococcaceae bacterium]|nr:SPFH domain-containing protein [Oscillospiraceae bacterium]
MAIAEVIKFEGPQDALVWKFPVEDFNATSQLIVDETHEALLVVNGNEADLFTAGRRTLSVPNIPIARKLIEIPTGGDSPFPCKVFFINKVHQMDLLWGTQGPIALEDPLYDIFMHVMANGSMSISVSESRKFMLKMVGFRDRFDPDDLISKFRGIISSHVKDCISKIMINGMLSYFMMNAHLFELSGVIKERLDAIFDEYGIKIQYFNIETIEVPENDYKKVSEAKERRSGRLIEGYTWQEERQMMIAEKFAGNQGTMGNVGGAVSGFMVGGAMSGSIAEIARNALNPDNIPAGKPPKNAAGTGSHVGNGASAVNVADFFNNKGESENAAAERASGNSSAVCPKCGAELPENAKFCLSCGEKIQTTDPNMIVCPGCGKTVPKGKFCFECGYKFASNVCPKCGANLPEGAKFCLECGEKI